jgi:hypothetical protein
MRRIEMMTAGAVSLAGLGALVALAIGSGNSSQKLAAQRVPPVEVRTEVIHRTVNVYRRQHAHSAGAGAGGPGGASGGAPAHSSAPASSTARTRSDARGHHTQQRREPGAQSFQV